MGFTEVCKRMPYPSKSEAGFGYGCWASYLQLWLSGFGNTYMHSAACITTLPTAVGYTKLPNVDVGISKIASDAPPHSSNGAR